MCSKRIKGLGLLAVIPLFLLSNSVTGQQPAPRRAPRQPARPAAVAPRDVVRTETAWPTGDRKTSVVVVERLTPAEVRVGQTFEYEIRLINLTEATINEVTLTEQLASDLEVKTISPEPANQAEGVARWTFATLGPAETKSIRVQGVATKVGSVEPCNTVSFAMRTCQKTTVVQPELALVKTVPGEVIICDPIPVKLVVTNRGTGSATDVTLTDKLPEGWTTTDGKTSFSTGVGVLRAGESREVVFEVKSSKTGTFTNEASATEAGGLTAKSEPQTTVVRQPVLEVTKKGPELVYVGRPVKYEITVTNKGDAAARDTLLVDALDASLTVVSGTEGATAEAGRVAWKLGTLEAGQSKRVALTCKANEIKTIENVATATAYCAEARATASTVVRGIPAILLEVEDLEDPIEVGSNVTYLITVTNQGSADDKDIVIKCVLPEEQEFVSAEGPVKFTAEGKAVAFEPLPTLRPKAKVEYRVTVKALKEQDVRFKVELTSDMLKTPVAETESTHLY